MKSASIILSKDFAIGETDDRLFGSFIEHMGSVVYNGVFEPGHPTADPRGFRGDVLELVKELKLSAMRYPGGNFTSGYRWEDSVGPVGDRPQRVELAWRALEPNTFGLDEFVQWTREVGAEPIMTLNLGTRGVDAARNLVEYCNFPQGGVYSDLRRSHGVESPYSIKVWCLGNELDGPWQIARKTAEEYGRLACEAGKVMKLVDPTIELVAVGSSLRDIPTFPEWDRQVLMETYDVADYISLHHYIGRKDHDTATYLGLPLLMEKQIEEVIATADFVKGVKRSNKVMQLSFDEWNVHRGSEVPYEPWTTGSPIDWYRFNVEDMLVFAGMLLNLLRHADRVKIACQSLLLNTNGVILTEKNGAAWRNSTYFPLLHASLYGRGTVLRGLVSSPTYGNATLGPVPLVDSVTVLNSDKRELTVFALNRSAEAVALSLDLRDFGALAVKEHLEVSSADTGAVNSAGGQGLGPKAGPAITLAQGAANTTLPAQSWNVLRFALATKQNG